MGRGAWGGRPQAGDRPEGRLSISRVTGGLARPWTSSVESPCLVLARGAPGWGVRQGDPPSSAAHSSGAHAKHVPSDAVCKPRNHHLLIGPQITALHLVSLRPLSHGGHTEATMCFSLPV